jgi:hypothetical protein
MLERGTASAEKDVWSIMVNKYFGGTICNSDDHGGFDLSTIPVFSRDLNPLKLPSCW